MAMYAIIECGGKQYRASQGEVLKVEKLNVEVGSIVNIDKVLMLSDDKVYVGTPWVDGAVVSCKVLEQDKDKKIIVYHYKAKKNIRKRYGHRQPFTSLQVQSISRDGQALTPEFVETPKPVKPVKKETTATAAETKPAKKTASAKPVAEDKPAKKVAAKKEADKPVKKTTTSAKKSETAASAEKPVKKTAAKTKKSTEKED